MEIKHIQNGGGGFFYAEKDGREKGKMSYFIGDNNVIVIDHTNVDPSSQGEGVGTKLVKAAVDYAHAESQVLKATCPFARAILDKHPEWREMAAV